MPQPDPDLTDEETLPDPPLEDLEAPRGRLVGQLPRFPAFPRRTPTPPSPDDAPQTTPAPPRAGYGGPGSETSSTGSTDPDAPVVVKREVLVNPKDFRDAVRQGVDMGFVLFGQFVGSAHSRRSGLAKDAARWRPTLEERQHVADPAFRIARRHISTNAEAMDAIDIALMAAGVGTYANRAIFNLDPLEDLPDDE